MGELEVVILGCGSSGGVPRGDGDWGACDPAEPRNRRSRCSILVRRQGADGLTTALIDTSPDLRAQMLSADVKAVDAVLYTHDHADQTHGVDDLRVFAMRARRRIPAFMDAATRERQARALVRLVQSAGAVAIVNDRVELALAVGADGVHLGRDDGDVRVARGLMAEGLIGASCYDELERAARAVADGADAIAFGSMFPSPTKPHAVHASLDLLGAARARWPTRRVIAIGGIDSGNIHEVAEAGEPCERSHRWEPRGAVRPPPVDGDTAHIGPRLRGVDGLVVTQLAEIGDGRESEDGQHPEHDDRRDQLGRSPIDHGAARYTSTSSGVPSSGMRRPASTSS